MDGRDVFITSRRFRGIFGALARHILWSQCKDTDTTTGFKKSKKYVDTLLLEIVPLYPLDVH
jgi:hypothetical protein